MPTTYRSVGPPPAPTATTAILFAPTLEAVRNRGLLSEVENSALDQGYDSKPVQALGAAPGLPESEVISECPPNRVNLRVLSNGGKRQSGSKGPSSAGTAGGA